MAVAFDQHILARLISGVLILVAAPYVVGFLYAFIMIPAYSLVCHDKLGQSNIISDSIKPVDIADYRYFLMLKGCKAPLPPVPFEPSCRNDDLQCLANGILSQSLGGVTKSDFGKTRFFGDDIVSALFDYVARSYAAAANTGAMLATELRNTNPVFQAIAVLFFLAAAYFVTGVGMRAIDHAADGFIAILLGRRSSTPSAKP